MLDHTGPSSAADSHQVPAHVFLYIEYLPKYMWPNGYFLWEEDPSLKFLGQVKYIILEGYRWNIKYLVIVTNVST